MYSERALQEYTATSVQTGSPVRLVAMLYEGALRFLHEAEVAIDQRNHPLKAEKINRAMRIVQELTNALDESASPELVQRLRALYEYAEYEMLQASTFNDARHLHHASSVLTRLHSSWSTLADRNVEAADLADSTNTADTAVDTVVAAFESSNSSPRVDVPPPPPSAPTPWTAHTEDHFGDRVSSLSISA